MEDPTLSRYRTFLVGWTGVMLAHFTYVQSKTGWGAREVAWHPWNLWHPFYFGVVNATFVVIPFLVFGIGIARRYGGWSSAIGRAILLLGTGTSLWGLGNFYWFVQNAKGEEAPYPSLADAGYLAVLPFAAWALWELARVVGIDRSDWALLPLALAVAFPLNAWIMLPQGIGAGTFDTPLTTAISTTYILSDVVLLGVGIIVATGARRAAGGRFFAPVLAVVGSIFLLYVGDLVFNYRIAKELFYNGEVSDLLYGAFIILAATATWLFLRADVRAAAAVAQVDDADWEPVGSAQERAGGVALAPLDEVATAILRGQERVMGEHAARGVARSVAGIEVAADGVVSATQADAIDAMVREFRALAGPLGEMACWTAARPALARHPEIDVASLRRFRGDVTPPPRTVQAA
ncbi:MAG: sensor-containing diguanylate cyclase/phosphodiesterase [Thermoleophilia bacterium]|nr:sensor-containing diguanylate cyclase/phosphodiesterase [Thermoleophilia bacterium]